MKRHRALSWILASIFGITIGLATVQLGASVGEPVDPPGPGGGSGPGGGQGGSNKNVPPKKLQEIYDSFEISLHATRIGKERFYSAYWDLMETATSKTTAASSTRSSISTAPMWQNTTISSARTATIPRRSIRLIPTPIP
jgi:hypothetical protein